MAMTPEQKLEALEMFNAGASATVIATKFNTSRNSVLGYLHRLRLKGDTVRMAVRRPRSPDAKRPGPKPIVPVEVAPPKRPTLPKVRTSGPAPTRADIVRAIPVDPEPKPRCAPVSILDVRTFQCRSVVGRDGEYNLAMFCGMPVKPGSSYCRECHRVVYMPHMRPTRRRFVFGQTIKTQENTVG